MENKTEADIGNRALVGEGSNAKYVTLPPNSYLVGKYFEWLKERPNACDCQRAYVADTIFHSAMCLVSLRNRLGSTVGDVSGMFLRYLTIVLEIEDQCGKHYNNPYIIKAREMFELTEKHGEKIRKILLKNK